MAKRRPGLGRLPTPVRRRVLLALGSVEDRLLAAQAEAGAAFVREVSDELPVEQAVPIFLRIVEVPDRHHDTVARQTLALVEQSDAIRNLDAEYGSDDFLSRVLRRLGGRRQDALRARVAANTARARDVTRSIYVQGAHEIIEILNGVLQPAEAVQLYVEALEIPPEWAEVIFHETIADVDLPAA